MRQNNLCIVVVRLCGKEISEIFSITPYLTNRIVLRYADYEVSSDVADVYFAGEQGYTLASDKEVISDLDTTETNYIYYSYSYDQNNFVNTSAFYSTLYTVKFSVETKKNFTSFSDEALKLLFAYYWPGNVRELENTIERACVLGKPPVIRADDLRLHVAGSSNPSGKVCE